MPPPSWHTIGEQAAKIHCAHDACWLVPARHVPHAFPGLSLTPSRQVCPMQSALLIVIYQEAERLSGLQPWARMERTRPLCLGGDGDGKGALGDGRSPLACAERAVGDGTDS